MHYSSFLSIQVSNAARLFWIIMVSDLFLVIIETPPCFPLLVKNPPSCQCAFRLLTWCAKTSSSLGNTLLYTNRFYSTSNLWPSLINSSVFPGYGAFVPVINLYSCFAPRVMCAAFGLLVLSYVSRCCVFMLILCCICVLLLAL
jgi:hypothetical protein